MSILKPSYATGYAKNASQSAHPNLWDGLVGAWMPSLGVTGETLRDVSGNGNHGTLTNMDAATDWVGTSKGLALDFDRANDIVIVNDQNGFFRRSGTDDLSVSCWIYPTITGGYQSILGNRSSHYSFNYLIYEHLNGGTIQLHGNTQNKSNYTPPSGKWTHIVATVRKNIYRLYANGELVGGPSSYNYWVANPTLLCFGAYSTNASEPYGGRLTDTSIYFRALSPSEIKQLYVDSLSPFRLKKRTVVRVPATVPTVTKVGSFKKPVTIAKPSYQAGYARNASESENPKLWDGLVGAWMPSLGVTGDTLRDVSGNGNHGTLYDDTHFTPTSKGLALDFDRNGDYVAVPPNDKFAFGGSDFTLLQWVKVRSQAGAGYGLWDTLNLGGIGYRSNSLVLFWSGSLAGYNKLGVFFQGGVRGTSDALPLNTWHLCGVRRRNAGTNGADIIANSQKYQFTCNVSLNTSSNVFGRVSDSSYWLDGRIASSQIWNRALSDAEIKQLYVDSLAPFRRKQRVSVAVPAGITFKPYWAKQSTQVSGLLK